MWSGKLTARSRIKGYDIILRGNVKILAENEDEKKTRELAIS